MTYSVLQAAAGFGAICPPGQMWSVAAGGCVVPPTIGPEPPCVEVPWIDSVTSAAGTSKLCRTCASNEPRNPDGTLAAHVAQTILQQASKLYAGPIDGNPAAPGMVEALLTLLEKYGLIPPNVPALDYARLDNPNVCTALVWEWYMHKARQERVTHGSNTKSAFVPSATTLRFEPSQPAMPGGATRPPPGGATYTAPDGSYTPDGEPARGGMDLWNGLSTGEKIGVVGGGLAALLLIGVVLKKAVFKKNARRSPRSLRAVRSADARGARSARAKHLRKIARLAADQPPATVRSVYRSNRRRARR